MKLFKKAISLLLVVALVIWCNPQSKALDTGAATIQVRFSASGCDFTSFPVAELTVSDGLAEQFGYTPAAEDHNGVAVEGPTVFDALVAAHIAKYGDAFTNHPTDYLVMSFGWVSKAFGSDVPSGFMVNDFSLNDGIMGSWGYTSYAADTARLNNGDSINYYFYQDLTFWSDYYTYFTEQNKTVKAGESFQLKLVGGPAWQLMSRSDAAPVSNSPDTVTFVSLNADGSFGTTYNDKKTDANGTVNFCLTKPGTYLISAKGSLADGSPVIPAYCKVTVQDDANMALTSADTPTTKAETGLSWAVKLGTDWTEPTGAQVIAGDFIVFTVSDKLYQLNRKNGEVITSTQMAAAASWGAAAPTYADGKIFVALGSGIVQAFDAITLAPLWKSESFTGQALTGITYSDGYLYTGFWNGETALAKYVCLSADDLDKTKADEVKTALWTVSSKGGYYGAGALITGDAIIFQSDNGVSDAVSDGGFVKSFNKHTGQPISSLAIHGDGRSAVSLDRNSGRIFFTTKSGYLYCATVDGNGTLSDLKAKQYAGQSISTPTVYGGRVYFGIGAFGSNSNTVVVADASTLNPIYTAPVPAYSQCTVLLSTAKEEETGKVYLYVTYNTGPGGIKVLEDSAGQTQPKISDLFLPAGELAQYCMSDVIAAPDGMLYFKNDSGYLIALTKRPVGFVGDVNADGVTDLLDVTGLSREVANWQGLIITITACDTDGDTIIDLKDVTTLSRYVAGWQGIVLGGVK